MKFFELFDRGIPNKTEELPSREQLRERLTTELDGAKIILANIEAFGYSHPDDAQEAEKRRNQIQEIEARLGNL